MSLHSTPCVSGRLQSAQEQQELVLTVGLISEHSAGWHLCCCAAPAGPGTLVHRPTRQRCRRGWRATRPWWTAAASAACTPARTGTAPARARPPLPAPAHLRNTHPAGKLRPYWLGAARASSATWTRCKHGNPEPEEELDACTSPLADACALGVHALSFPQRRASLQRAQWQASPRVLESAGSRAHPGHAAQCWAAAHVLAELPPAHPPEPAVMQTETLTRVGANRLNYQCRRGRKLNGATASACRD